MSDEFRDILETFDNPYPHREYVIESICPEFTSVCPKTGQPDFGELTITYVADRRCYELRNEGAFYEDVTNRILDDLVAVTEPRWMKIVAEYTPRGGIRTNIVTEYVAEDFENGDSW
jgi:7-cyano-7-deazaguanine reductase